MNILEFISKQVLGMAWLNELVGQILVQFFGLNLSSRVGGSLQFFIYDSIKILTLLVVLVFIVAYIQSYFPPERAKKILGRFNGFSGSLIAALLGVVTPFCSCSSVPIFIGFTRAGLPISLTFAFLIASPLVDVASLALLVSLFGFKIAIIYIILGLALAIISGTILGKLDLSNKLSEYRGGAILYGESENFSLAQRIEYAKNDTRIIVRKVAPFVLLGVGAGAIIHDWIPQELILSILGKDNPFTVLVATAVGIPIYASIFGTLPVAEALFAKGVPIGTILALIMSMTALSLPEMVMLSQVLRPRLLATFVGVVALGIMIVGYGFNAFGYLFL
ncbi:permease [Succinispira mobilis]|uniref:permease n=1 Tax=Succinispira mobilis TaxID=78120 RepID=UPI0003743A48|nr:permease [Succinispira mobilis]